MTQSKFQKFHARWTAWSLYLFAFSVPVSIAAAEFFLVFFLLSVVTRRESRAAVWRYAGWTTATAVLFAVWSALTICWSVRPDATAAKLHRLLFFLIIPAIPAVCAEPRTGVCRKTSMAAFLAGTAVSAVHHMMWMAMEIRGGAALFDTGSMTDAQFYMVGLAMLLPLAAATREARWSWRFMAPAAVLNVAGLILHFKRGCWLAFAGAAGVFAICTRRWKIILAGVAAGALMLSLAPVRERLAALPDEYTERQGGRGALWFKVAPALIARHPWGMGWKSVESRDLQGFAEYVQPGLNHLHNNFLQIILETGWFGAALWMVWMIAGALCGVRALRRCREKGAPAESAMIQGLLLAYLTLHLNGLVENNFGDGEILMLFCFVLGLMQSGRECRRQAV